MTAAALDPGARRELLRKAEAYRRAGAADPRLAGFAELLSVFATAPEGGAPAGARPLAAG